MAKVNQKSRLVRSDERLAILGLFSAVLTIGVFGYLNPSMFGMASMNTTTQAERVIKVEERPANIGEQLRNTDNSYAAEPMEATHGSQMNQYRYGTNGYPGY